jgi:outer membrane lipoprotein-sorting protein
MYIYICVFFAQNHALAQSKPDTVLNGWIEAHGKVKTWSASFTQTRTLKMLTRPLTTKGRIWFVAPNQFRWDLGEPAQTIALRRQDELLVVYPLLKRAERLSIASANKGEWRDALALFEAGFPRSQAELRQQFEVVSVVTTNASWEVLLRPANRSFRHYVGQMKVVLSTNDFTLTATELILGDGSVIRTDFGGPTLNGPVAKDLFDFSLGDEYKITELTPQ